MSHEKISAYSLDSGDKFDGTNYDTFVSAFRFMLDLAGKEYLLEDTVSPPADANLARDNRIVYRALHLNLNGQAQGIISAHSGNGTKAWKEFTGHYGKVDVGITVSLASELGHLHWTGGDYDFFTDFLSRFEKLVTDLRQRGFKYEDWVVAMMLVGKVPIDFIRHKVELEKPSDLKMSDVKSILSSSINFEESATTQASLIARQPSAQAAANRNDCGHCRDVVKKPYPKYIHPADRCYTLYPHRFDEDKKKREKEKERREKGGKKPANEAAAVAKQDRPTETVNVALAS